MLRASLVDLSALRSTGVRSLILSAALLALACGDDGRGSADSGLDTSSADSAIDGSDSEDASLDTGSADGDVEDADLEDADLADAAIDVSDAATEDASAEDATVDSSTSDAGGACAAIELRDTGMVPGTTVDAGNDFEPEGEDCPLVIAVSGPDRVYSFTVPDAQTWRVTVTPAGEFNPMVYVRGTCSAEGVCLDSGGRVGPGGSESVDLNGEGETFFIIVDTDITAGPETRGGAYTVGVEVR